ncbi:hypothetical protein CABS01_09507 [Colletotrichum abscissum]|uniref:uncharacterized protein n=1 Tax=Colletotrichum abscissum TaxID=1671311 RepID=UPI0027D53546|nr:uncharacterized protein CABS01_09507 [Colletotrichum abscissum]KAK1501776.1 hypothetical protein CABS01_09507 [Colletotrichum abscissum]
MLGPCCLTPVRAPNAYVSPIPRVTRAVAPRCQLACTLQSLTPFFPSEHRHIRPSRGVSADNLTFALNHKQ